MPDAGAVDLCVTQIHSANSCENFLSVSRVYHIDDEVAEQEALVTAEVEMIVLSPFAVCSPVASDCTGTCWDLRAGKATTSPSSGSKDSFAVTHRVRIEKSFKFRKADSGGWRCDTTSLHRSISALRSASANPTAQLLCELHAASGPATTTLRYSRLQPAP